MALKAFKTEQPSQISGSYREYAEKLEPILPLIRDSVGESSDAGSIRENVVNKMTEAGLFRLLLPKKLGGFEMDLVSYLDVLHSIASCDGSPAWVVSQICALSYQAAFMKDEVAKTIWENEKAILANGPPLDSRADVVEGGYQVSGSFTFSSGCLHATWLAGGAFVYENGQPRRYPNGNPEMRYFFVPKSQVEILGAWNVHGLKGTGSCQVRFKPGFVRADFSALPVLLSPVEQGPLYKIPQTLTFAMGLGAVGLGIAWNALEVFVKSAQTTRLSASTGLQRDQALVQQSVGEARAIYGASKAFLWSTTAEAWDIVQSNKPLDLETRCKLRLAATHAMQECARVVDLIYTIYGTNSIFADKQINRCFQDVLVLKQHYQGRTSFYGTVGQILLGDVPEFILGL